MSETVSAKPSRGRPPGSVSFVEVTLGDLEVALGTPNAKVRVDRKWALAVGVVSSVSPIVQNVAPVIESHVAVNVE